MSIRENAVPKSLEVQRTKAKMLPGANDSTRRRRSRIFSSTERPNRMRFSMRFSSQRSSTSVASFMNRSVLWKLAHCADSRSRQRLVADLDDTARQNKRIVVGGYPQRSEWRGPLEEIRRISG